MCRGPSLRDGAATEGDFFVFFTSSHNRHVALKVVKVSYHLLVLIVPSWADDVPSQADD